MNNVHTMAEVITAFFAKNEPQLQNANTLSAVWRKILFSMDERSRKFDGQKTHNGENLFYHSTIIERKNGVLLIEVDHPGWITLFQFSQKYIVRGFKKFAPELNINSLAFKLSGQKIQKRGENKTMDVSKKNARQEIKIAMLGDSITFGADWRVLLNVRALTNFGICGDTTGGMLQRVPEVCASSPSVCFFMGGINDIFCGIPPKIIAANIKAIANALTLRGIKVVVQSILFVSTLVEDWQAVNQRVNAVNSELKNFCAQKHPFVDVNGALCADGALKNAHTQDGVHLSQAGYAEWAKLIRYYINSYTETNLKAL
jgi:lysophospholipase L1-like esterase